MGFGARALHDAAEQGAAHGARVRCDTTGRASRRSTGAQPSSPIPMADPNPRRPGEEAWHGGLAGEVGAWLGGESGGRGQRRGGWCVVRTRHGQRGPSKVAQRSWAGPT